MKDLIPIIMGLLIICTAVSGQTLVADGHFNQFVTYYISSVDLETGGTDVQLFYYNLSCPDCPTDATGRYETPVYMEIDFSINIESPALGLDEEIAYLYTTQPIQIRAPLNLDNRDFTIDNMEVYDTFGDEVSISVEIDDSRTKEISELTDLFTTIVQTAQLPDGIYRFTMDLHDVGTYTDDGTWVPYDIQCVDNCETILNVSTPVMLELVEGSPGGNWGDIQNNIVYTTFPVFTWTSDLLSPAVVDNCPECGFFIRVAEFRSEDHTSIDDAIEDLTTLPVDQAQGWYPVGNQLSLIYPLSDAIELYPGGIYVYQVQKRFVTTTGMEEMESPIYVFSIAGGNDGTYDQELQSILTIETDALYNDLFDPGNPLSGYKTTDVVTYNGEPIGPVELQNLILQFNSSPPTLNVEVE